ncbi:hypothetical protein FACS189445_1230 [Spirochaetia bacterium]|nr:hypothetical protein FACS189445_1230 [Spirochaetia bacterium]
MRIKSVELNKFKRFSHLLVEELPATAKLVMLVGPNGSGKTSFFEAFNLWHQSNVFNHTGDQSYFDKKIDENPLDSANWNTQSRKKVNIQFFDAEYKGKAAEGKFYFRSAYRNEPSFQIAQLNKQSDPTRENRLTTLMLNDQTVSTNYQRLVSSTMAGLFDENNNNKTVGALRNELIGKIRESLKNVFSDLNLHSIGDPLSNGSFYFEKGVSKEFHYHNLSAGEKSAFDLILDIIIKAHYFYDAIYCIDEPETHMHTKLQGKVLRELYTLVPENSQLWVSTHSIGMLQEAEEIEKEYHGTVIFLDFDGRNFDTDETIRPAKINKAVMDKFYELAFGDFAKLMLPKKIVFCEGDPNGKSRKDFDKTIYTSIFGDNHPETFFVSAKSCGELENIETSLGEIMTKLLNNTDIIKIVDRDDRTEIEVADLLSKGIRTLERRNLESYLLDDSIIAKLCETKNQSEKYQECLTAKQAAIQASVSPPRNNSHDDIKSARGDIYNSVKRILGLTQCGNNADAFLRDTMSPLITPDTDIYKQLEQEIFGTNGDHEK